MVELLLHCVFRIYAEIDRRYEPHEDRYSVVLNWIDEALLEYFLSVLFKLVKPGSVGTLFVPTRD